MSRVLAGNPTVSESYRQRVLEALSETGLVVNANARTLRTRRTGVIGVVVGTMTNPYYPELVECISEFLTRQNLRMIVWNAGGLSETPAVDAIRGHLVDGVILATATEGSKALNVAIEHRLPIVLVNRSIDGAAVDQITSDNLDGGRRVAELFLEAGHRRLAVVGGDEAISTGRDRRRGFIERAREAGVVLPPTSTPEADFTHEDGRTAGLLLLRQSDRPTAIFCVNDLLAFGVLDAARALGLTSPGDVAIAGYDDVEMAGWHAFDLTTVRQPTDRMAERAVEMLLRRIEDPARPAQRFQFKARVVIRGSTG